MFDIGFTELLVIAVVALVVLGPERLPKAARFAGLWVRRARAQWDSVKGELERELATEEIKRNLRQAQDAVREAGQAVRESGEAMQRGLAQTQAEVRESLMPETDGAPSPQPDAAPESPPDGEVPASASENLPANGEPDAANPPAGADAGESSPVEPDPQAELFPSPAKTRTP